MLEISIPCTESAKGGCSHGGELLRFGMFSSSPWSLSDMENAWVTVEENEFVQMHRNT